MNPHRIGTLAEQREAEEKRRQATPRWPRGEALVLAIAKGAALLGLAGVVVFLIWLFLIGFFSLTP